MSRRATLMLGAVIGVLAALLLGGIARAAIPSASGAPGSEAVAVRMANVNHNGTLVPGGDAMSARRRKTGDYEVTFPTTTADCAAVVSTGLTGPSGAGKANTAAFGAASTGIAAGDPATVRIYIVSALRNAALDSGFHLVVVC